MKIKNPFHNSARMFSNSIARKVSHKFYNIFLRRLPISYGALGKLSKKLRAAGAKLFIAGIGKNVNIETGAIFSDDLILGDNSGIGVNARIQSGVKIGKNVMMGEDCLFITRNHIFSQTDVPMNEQGLTEINPIVIEDDVWIGSRVIILPGVTVGTGVIIGAGAVVTKHIPPYMIVAGNPARIIRCRKESEPQKN